MNCSPSKLFINLLRSTPRDQLEVEDSSSPRTSTNSSCYSYMSSSPASASPCSVKSPWTHTSTTDHHNNVSDYDEQRKPSSSGTGLIGTLTREQGHLYSLAAYDDLLYTGSDSKNIRVWRRTGKNHQEFSAFKSSSGLVKAIVIAAPSRGGAGDILIFTGHQDGKIRAWKKADDDTSAVTHRRAGTLPTLKDLVTSSMKPWSYIRVRRSTTPPKRAIRVRHFDAVSCLSLDEEAGLLYSGSWDKTIKVWRLDDYKCLDSVTAHDDAINSVAVGFDGLVFSGSADGTVKMWRREMRKKKKKDKVDQYSWLSIRHVLVMTLMRQETAVTALAVAGDDGVVYCGSSDGLINYWVRDGPRRLALARGGAINRGHKMAVLCLVAEGRIVVSGSADGTVRVWSRAEGCKSGPAHQRIAVLIGHSGPVKCLAVVEEEEQVEGGAQGRSWVVYSGSLDKTVKIWRVDERVKEAAASSHVMRRVRHVMGEWEPRF